MKHVEYLEKNDIARKNAFSPAVVTEGGRIVWLSGQLALRDESGNDIAGQFEPQVRAIFAAMEKTIRKAGGASLADLVTMTIFVTDTRYLERFVEIRREMFRDAGENYPASTFIGVSSLPFPGVVVEIQGTAVVG
jgi:enamine deaminase RidA (YjgF/YER057c/UK114 family)